MELPRSGRVPSVVDLAQAAMWHRQVAALVAAADRAGVAGVDLPALKARLLAQQQRFSEAAARAGGTSPTLAPTPTEVAAAAPALGDLSPTAVTDAIRTISVTLDAVDAVLTPLAAPPPAAVLPASTPTQPAPSTQPAPPPAAPMWPPHTASSHTLPASPPAPAQAGATPGYAPAAPRPMPTGVRIIASLPAPLRNTVVYGGFAAVVLAMQLILMLTVTAGLVLTLATPFCLLFLPASAWVAGWFTIGYVFRQPDRPAPSRTPRLGAAICLAPNLVLCLVAGAFFAISKL